MDNFTPIPALIGGVMIGLSAVWLLAVNGRIAGCATILHRMVIAAPGDLLWRAAFIAGLVLAGFAWHLYAGPAPTRPGFGLGWAAAAGLLVGFGTYLGSGCTSGHGVCGLGRFSMRSLVAVMAFMATGMVAAYVTRHVLGVQS